MELNKQDQEIIEAQLEKQKNDLLESFEDAHSRAELEKHLNNMVYREQDILEKYICEKFNLTVNEISEILDCEVAVDMRDKQNEIIFDVLDERFPE